MEPTRVLSNIPKQYTSDAVVVLRAAGRHYRQTGLWGSQWQPGMYKHTVMYVVKQEAERLVHIPGERSHPTTQEGAARVWVWGRFEEFETHACFYYRESVVRITRWLISAAISPQFYDPTDWEGHSNRTLDDVLEALDRASILAETGALRGTGPQ